MVQKNSVHPRCPRCGNHKSYQIEPGRFCCNKCQGVFEGADFGFVDDRPNVNAEKMESMRNFLRS